MRKLLKKATAISVVAMILFSFCISVSAVEETNNSQDGLVASITTEKDSFQAKGVSVTWNKITGVYGYRLYRKYDGGSWTKVKDTTSTSFIDSGAKKGKKVTYTVRCIDKKGNAVSNYNKTGWSITRK